VIDGHRERAARGGVEEAVEAKGHESSGRR
jgi:hypothetical protein